MGNESESQTSNSPGCMPAPSVYLDGQLKDVPMRSSVCWHLPSGFVPLSLHHLKQNMLLPMNLAGEPDQSRGVAMTYVALTQSSGEPGKGCRRARRSSSRGDRRWGYHATRTEFSTRGRAEQAKNAHAVLSSGVELTAEVAAGNVNFRLVDETSHHVRVAVEEDLHALDGTLGHDASAVALFGAVGDDLALGVGNVVQSGRAPKTEICQHMG